MKKIVVGLLGISALSVGVACAAPKPYSNFVVFGDSLVDAGQFPDTVIPGQTKRFTNRTGPNFFDTPYGPVSSMLIGERLGMSSTQLAGSTSPVNQAQGLKDGDNWAVGGYRTDQIYDSITAVSGSVVADGGTTLRVRDGYLPSLQAQGQSIDRNTLFYISGGGNDFLQGLILSPQQAARSADRLAASVTALQEAGGRYFMVWMLPDIGLTPQVYGTPLQDFVSDLSTAFNAQLVQQLSDVSADVIVLNIPKLLSEGLQNPAQFGLDGNENLIGTCFNGDGCTENLKYGINSATADPSKLLFNDSVHPTITGQRLIADYGYSILAAPWEITLLPEMARSALNHHQNNLTNYALNSQPAWQASGQWSSYASASGERTNYRSQSSASKGDSDHYGLSFGASYRINEQWRAGVGVSLQESTLTAGVEDSKYQLNSYLLSPFIQYNHQAFWADANLSAGRLDYDSLRRKMALNTSKRTEKGDTKGSVLGIHSRVGYQLFSAQEPLQLSPYVSMSYARFKVDNYAEKGSHSTALTFAEQKRTSKRLGAGLLASYQLSAPLRLSAEAGYEKEFNKDQQRLGMSLNSVNSIDFKLKGYKPDSSLGTLGLGAAYQISDALTVQGNYNYMHADSVRQHALAVGVSLNW